MKQRGNYQSKRKEAVQRLFSEQSERCFTVEEAQEALVMEGQDVGKTTVYRAISRLLEQGIVRRYAPQEPAEAARYQYSACREGHLHIRCMHCGELAHLDCDAVSEFCEHITVHHGFVLNEAQTTLTGCCPECAHILPNGHKGETEK